MPKPPLGFRAGDVQFLNRLLARCPRFRKFAGQRSARGMASAPEAGLPFGAPRNGCRLSVEIAPGNEAAPEAYPLAAREILDVCDAMISARDGQPARGTGGTAERVNGLTRAPFRSRR